MTDWLSEVLEGLVADERREGWTKDGGVLTRLYVRGLPEAHKLISAQLIREQINELERLPKAVEENHMLRYAKTGDGWEELRSWHVDAYLKDRQKDLTNKLKALEDNS